ncbi:MAG: hypothetical protein COU25_04060 [Candidatus Levybacteria bacterium CG10_big_fil_rev_8_21_14_0_10_35_13]|nr:MAG: hypothetical protein COU25_04060 [Candidatus Levybacteria bacterium CG10_big_fil_rev_8_21_14_0_10_35_13]
MKKPFFSIIIPTFNRVRELEIAVKCIVSQKYKNFEIIIVDNSSTGKTGRLVKQFKDKRIRLYVNHRNLGWIKSLKRGLELAEGEYVILQGDDDYMVLDIALKNLRKTIKKYSPGYIRLNYLSYLTWKNQLVDFKLNKKNNINKRIFPNSSTQDVLEFIEETDPFFIAGIVFKNKYPKSSKIINSELCPWLMILFYNTSTFGGYFSSNYSYISSWQRKVSNSGHPFFRLERNEFTFESYFKVIKKIAKRDADRFMKQRLKQVILLFPANKQATNNSNLVKCARRVLRLSPDFKFSPVFWLSFIFAYIFPNIILELIREIFFKRMIHEAEKNRYVFNKNYDFLQSIKTQQIR